MIKPLLSKFYLKNKNNWLNSLFNPENRQTTKNKISTMGILNKLFKSNESLSDNELIDANACPNCWGIQEYDGKFEEYLKDSTKSNISGDKSQRKAFIQQFVETNITGIKLKKDGNTQICPSCKTKFKFVSSKAI